MKNIPIIDIGNISNKKFPNVMPDLRPTSIFCGLPVIVIALPIFDENISANKKGLGSTAQIFPI